MWPLARGYLLAALRAGVKEGSLVIIEDSTTYLFGQPPPPSQTSVTLRIKNMNFWCRLYVSLDLGCKNSHTISLVPYSRALRSAFPVAEAYMHGDFIATPSDVKSVLNVSNTVSITIGSD
jgi:cyclopropane-fatty-acyl-phospholipid synthase